MRLCRPCVRSYGKNLKGRFISFQSWYQAGTQSKWAGVPDKMKYDDLRSWETPDINADAIEASLRQFTLTEQRSMITFVFKQHPQFVAKEFKDVDLAISIIMQNLIHKDVRDIGKVLDGMIEMAQYFLRHTSAPHIQALPIGVWVYCDKSIDA